ncbi:hypothetical protein EMIHUDRAFT_229031 [Emiliania huxleyi CCMP1516]|uniref:Uncharacterized protein n=2 Tax=Emiliania huxleyi TaxID=2903 RepID=A0A0D3KDV4_EMIH1|nr:hypothetical protein EMIHUDRAFT_229031 [Emiliania huxleyi CCMP1516]EOD33939.1 hypothetical protein EMIHUDRAFT_229031 [Emiliania huxleyi CCMP1516]|eukprot:XP_005786368.1 hypothetical protein EMIHUDRAFT_229031 [Emiliania huxleyi CCMP1516]
MLTLLVSCLSLSGELTLGLVVPSFPWTFGPYQAQGLQLAVELSSRHGWKVYWLPVVESLPEGLYRTSDEAAATARMRRPPPGWDDEHGAHIAGYIGRSWGIYPRVKQVGELNKAAREHGLHAYVMLMDVNMLLRDEDFAIPALSWFPYHFDSLNHVDGYTLAAFSGAADASPVTAASERGWRRAGRKLPVRWIPHIVEPELLGVGGPPHPLTLPAGTFLILMQGGNYERSDRKAIDTC